MVSYLKAQSLIFYFRIKKDADRHNANGKSVQVSWLLYDAEINEARKLNGLRPVYGHRLFVSGRKLADGDYLIVVSNCDEHCAIKVYGYRWEIETLFGCLKSKDSALKKRD